MTRVPLSHEEDFSIPTPDGKKIYGLVTRAADQTDRVVILSHGLTGSPLEYLHMAAAVFFATAGYDVVRFFYYAHPPDARKLQDCTLALHATDLNLVCEHFRPQYKNLFVAGHSFGGLTALLARPRAAAFSFWDASFVPFEATWEKGAARLEGTPYYTRSWGYACLVSAAMYEEVKALTRENSVALARRIETPSQVVLAGHNGAKALRALLYESLVCRKDLVEIEGADHTFTRGASAERLLREALTWFNSF